MRRERGAGGWAPVPVLSWATLDRRRRRRQVKPRLMPWQVEPKTCSGPTPHSTDLEWAAFCRAASRDGWDLSDRKPQEVIDQNYPDRYQCSVMRIQWHPEGPEWRVDSKVDMRMKWVRPIGSRLEIPVPRV